MAKRQAPQPDPGRDARTGSCGFDADTLREQLQLAERNGWTTNSRLLQLWWVWCESDSESESDDPRATAAANEILDTIRRPVLRRLLQMLPDADEAESVTQETLMTVVQKRHEFRAQSSVLAWAQGIALNKAREARRRYARRRETSLDVLAESGMPEAPHLSSAEHDIELVRQVLEATIGADDREIIRLTAEGHTRDEIAAALGMPAGTVATRLHRARTRMQDALRRRMNS